MPGVDEFDLDALDDFDFLAELRRRESRQRFGGIFLGVKRQRGGVLAEAALVRELRVFFLQVRGVRQDELAQIVRAARAIHRPLKTLRNEPRQPATVVDVRVREDDDVDGFGRNRQRRPVAEAKLLQALKQPAVEQDPPAVNFEEVLGAGDRARSSKKTQRRHPPMIGGYRS